MTKKTTEIIENLVQPMTPKMIRERAFKEVQRCGCSSKESYDPSPACPCSPYFLK